MVPDSPPPRRPPEVLGRFRLLEKLGEGGMAAVYRAEMHGMAGFSKRVALKIIHPHAAHHPDFQPLFISEARLGGYLSHPNIVQTLDFGEHEGYLFLALEQVDGPTLEQVLTLCALTGRPIPLDVALQVLVQACRGLEAAHGATDHDGHPLHLVHRDLKPSNLLIDRHGVLKLADFGVARARSNLVQTSHHGVIKGTARYMSPEQAWGEGELDGRSDLFAVGAILFETLTGRPLYEGEAPMAVLRMAQDADVEPRLALVPDVPQREAVLALLRRVLAGRREDRPATAGALAVELEAVLALLEERRDLAAWVVGLEAEARTVLEARGAVPGFALPSLSALPGPAARTPLSAAPPPSSGPRLGVRISGGASPLAQAEPTAPLIESGAWFHEGDPSSYGRSATVVAVGWEVPVYGDEGERRDQTVLAVAPPTPGEVAAAMAAREAVEAARLRAVHGRRGRPLLASAGTALLLVCALLSAWPPEPGAAVEPTPAQVTLPEVAWVLEDPWASVREWPDGARLLWSPVTSPHVLGGFLAPVAPAVESPTGVADPTPAAVVEAGALSPGLRASVEVYASLTGAEGAAARAEPPAPPRAGPPAAVVSPPLRGPATARITIEAPCPSVLILDGRPLACPLDDAPLRPGARTLVSQTVGGRRVQDRLEVEPGSSWHCALKSDGELRCRRPLMRRVTDSIFGK